MSAVQAFDTSTPAPDVVNIVRESLTARLLTPMAGDSHKNA